MYPVIKGRIREKLSGLFVPGYMAHFAAVFITVLLVSGSLLAGYFSHKIILKDERINTLATLGIIRASLEGLLNSRLLLGQGLVSYLSVRSGLSAGEFRAYSEKLIKSDPMIRNISVIKGTTIIYAYPLETNRSAIGVDISKIPAQREQILKVIETGKAVVITNVHLVQGGVATICRMPVFTGRGPSANYWGQVSIVLMQDVLFTEAGMPDVLKDLKLFLAEIMPDGSSGEPLYGNRDIIQHDPVILDIHFPYGSWRIAAVPERGWGYSDTRSVVYTSVFSFVSLMLGWLIYWIMMLGRRVQQLESLLPVCSSCGRIRDDRGEWNSPNKYFSEKSPIKVSHGICPECTEKLYGEQPWYKRGKDK